MPYLGSTNGTASYKVRKVVYSLPTDFDRLMFIRQTDSDNKLTEIEPRLFFQEIPDPSTTTSPRNYYFSGLDSSRRRSFGHLQAERSTLASRHPAKGITT